MKLFPVFTILTAVVISSTFGKDLGFRRVRDDGSGEVSSFPLRGNVPSEPTGCSRGRYINPEVSRTRSPSPQLDQLRYGARASPPKVLVEARPVSTPPIQFITKDYDVYDSFRHRTIEFFDPEEWVCCNPQMPFPSYLDIPAGWAIYNPVTVQAPKPTIIRDLGQYRYTGLYYACPSYANPFDYAWYFHSNSATSPCKWIWYQSHQEGPMIQDEQFSRPANAALYASNY